MTAARVSKYRIAYKFLKQQRNVFVPPNLDPPRNSMEEVEVVRHDENQSRRVQRKKA